MSIRTTITERLETVPVTRYMTKLIKDVVKTITCEICGKPIPNFYGGALLRYGWMKPENEENFVPSNYDGPYYQNNWSEERRLNAKYHHFHQLCIMRAINTYNPNSEENSWAHEEK